jgi:hypothetical protein
MSGCRIDIRLSGWNQVQSIRSRRTFRVPSSPTRALKINLGDLVVRDSYLGIVLDFCISQPYEVAPVG